MVGVAQCAEHWPHGTAAPFQIFRARLEKPRANLRSSNRRLSATARSVFTASRAHAEYRCPSGLALDGCWKWARHPRGATCTSAKTGQALALLGGGALLPVHGERSA